MATLRKLFKEGLLGVKEAVQKAVGSSGDAQAPSGNQEEPTLSQARPGFQRDIVPSDELDKRVAFEKIAGPVKTAGKTLSDIAVKATSKTQTIDPALKQQLAQRGQTQTIANLEQDTATGFGQFAESLAETVSGITEKKQTIDPALKQQLAQRGQANKLSDVERPVPTVYKEIVSEFFPTKQSLRQKYLDAGLAFAEAEQRAKDELANSGAVPLSDTVSLGVEIGSIQQTASKQATRLYRQALKKGVQSKETLERIWSFTDQEFERLGQEGLSDLKRIFSSNKESFFDSAKKTLKNAPTKAREALLTRFAPLRPFEKQIRVTTGKTRAKGELPLEQRFELSAGIPAKAEKDIRNFRQEIVKPIGKNKEDFNYFLALKRIESRLDTGLERAQVADWTPEKVRASTQALQNKVGIKVFNQFKVQALKYNRSLDQSLQKLADSEVITKEGYDAIKENNDFYARFKVLQYTAEQTKNPTSGRGGSLSLNKKQVIDIMSGIKDDDFKLQDLLSTAEEVLYTNRLTAEKNKLMLSLRPLVDADVDGVVVQKLRSEPVVTERKKKVSDLTTTISELREKIKVLSSESRFTKQEQNRLKKLENDLASQENDLYADVNAFFAEDDLIPRETAKVVKAREALDEIIAKSKSELSQEAQELLESSDNIADLKISKPNDSKLVRSEARAKVLSQLQPGFEKVKDKIVRRIKNKISPQVRAKIEQIEFPDLSMSNVTLGDLEKAAGRYIKMIKNELPDIQLRETLDIKVERDLVNFLDKNIDRKLLAELESGRTLKEEIGVQQKDYDLLSKIKQKAKELEEAQRTQDIAEGRRLGKQQGSIDKTKANIEQQELVTESAQDALNNIQREVNQVRQQKDVLKKELSGLRDKTKDDLPDRGKDFDIVSYYTKGVREDIALPKDVAVAIKNFGSMQTGVLEKALRAGATPFKWGATTANAGFQVVNAAIGDPLRNYIFFKYGSLNPVTFIFDLVYAHYSSFRGNFGKMNPLFEEFLESGAANSTIARSIRPQAFDAKAQQLATGAGKVLNSVAQFANALEEGGKLTGFKQGLRQVEKGNVSMDELADEVRKFAGSPDFFRQGNAAAEANLLFMFLNARIQGEAADFSRMFNVTKPKDMMRTWAKAASVVGVPTLTLAVYNQERFKDDLDRLSDTEKNNNWIIFTDKFKTNQRGELYRAYHKIPKRDTVKIISNVIEAAVDFSYKRDYEGAKKFGVKLLEDIFPINISGDSVIERGESVISSMNPILKVPLEYVTGRNFFFHSDTVPEYLYGVESEQLPPEQQYYLTTPKLYRWLGEQLGVSPIRLQNAFSGMFASTLQKNPVQAALDRFDGKGRLDLTDVEKKQLEEVVESVEAQASEKLKVNRLAQQIYEDIGDLSKEEQRERLSKMKKDGLLTREVYDRYKKVSERFAVDYNAIDRSLADLKVTNGARAKQMYRLLKDMTPEEQKTLLSEWKAKGLLSRKIYDQVRWLQNNQKEADSLASNQDTQNDSDSKTDSK